MTKSNLELRFQARSGGGSENEKLRGGKHLITYLPEPREDAAAL